MSPRSNSWSIAETEALTRLNACGATDDEISTSLGRSPAAVRSRKCVIGLRLPQFKPPESQRHRPRSQNRSGPDELEQVWARSLSVFDVANELTDPQVRRVLDDYAWRSHSWVDDSDAIQAWRDFAHADDGSWRYLDRPVSQTPVI